MPRKRRKHIIKFSIKDEITEESELDTIGNHLFTILGFIVLIFSVFILASPIIAYCFGDGISVIVCLAIVLITSPMTIPAIKYCREFTFKSVRDSLFYLIKNIWIQRVLITIINLVILLRIGLQTMLPTLTLLLIYVLSIFTSKVITRFKRVNYGNTISFAIIPLVLSVLLTINYFISFNETHEMYTFSHNFQRVRSYRSTSGNMQMSTLITLKNNKYSNNYGIRIFSMIEDVQHSSKIKYTFKTGLFGIRVLTNYKFY